MAYDRYDRRPERDWRDDPRGGERGFFERAGDEVRSWFGDDDAERRRRRDEVYDERYDRDRGGFARGDRGGYRSPDAYPSWARSNRDEGYASGNRLAPPRLSGQRYDRASEGRQFDDGGYPRDGYGYGESDYGYRRSGGDDAYRGSYGDRASGTRDYGTVRGGYDSGYGDDQHGYRSWRDRQVSEFDRDYDEYRRENRQRFESEFATWRANRRTQRDSLNQVKEHQEVVGSDGEHVGKVDHVRSDHLLLTKTDPAAGGHHHAIPSSWVATVADKVTLNKTGAEAKKAWRDAENRGGLFGEDRDDGIRGTRARGNLDRSFSGTY